MSDTGKLQKAIQATIAAGYQLNSEAFEFLNEIAATADPTMIMERALQRMEELNEKPLFIDRIFLEETLGKIETPEEKKDQPQTAETNTEEKTENPTPEGALLFQPYAKNVEADLHIIEEPTSKFSSNCTIEDYLQYFQDRFKRLEHLLRQRIDVKAATPIIEALKSQAKAKLKIVCMITEKREAKQNIILTVEDLQSSATVLITHKSSEDLHRKAQMLLPDQVVCLSVVKTRSRLFLAEDIIFPEVGQKNQHRASEPVYAVLTSDIHVGSKKFCKDAFKNFILWLQGKYGNDKMREIAGHVKYVLMAGDVVDGVGVYPGQSKELDIKDIFTQYRALASYIRRIPEYIEVLIIPGDHDAAPKALPQPCISQKYAGELFDSKRVHLLPDPCTVSIHGVEVVMYHGRSLIDVASSVPGIGLNQACKAMKVLMQSRHLAPTYGQRTLIVPMERDCLVIDRAPDILHTGHLHLLKNEVYRGVLMVNSGCWQTQTEYQEKGGIIPVANIVPVVNLQTMQVNLLNFGD